MKRRILLIAIVVLAVAGIAYAMSKQGLAVRAYKVGRGPIREYIDERGKTRLPVEHIISMPFAGRIERITIVEGDEVAADEVVARVASEDLDDALAEAEAAVERLTASIARNEDISVEQRAQQQAEQFVQSMDATVQSAYERLTAGKARLEYAKTFLDRIQRLTIRDAQSEDELDRARLSHVESAVEYRQNELVWKSLTSIKAATNLLPHMVTDYIARKSLSGAVLQKEKQELEARLSQMRTRKRRGEMRSPVHGIVLKRAISNEQYLPAGAELLRIGQLESLEIECDVLSQDVVRIQADDPVEIYGPAVRAELGSGPAGNVSRIEPAGFTKVSSLGVEQQRVRVIVRFDSAVWERLREHNVGVDYRVRARVFTDSRENSLIVPRSTLFRNEEGGWSLYAIRDGRSQRIDVQLGLINDDVCEVASGLEDGELVILSPENSLSNGDRVSPQIQSD